MEGFEHLKGSLLALWDIERGDIGRAFQRLPKVILEVLSPAIEEGRKLLEFGPENLQREQAVGSKKGPAGWDRAAAGTSSEYRRPTCGKEV